MTMHTNHPDSHTSGFNDECPRCAQYPTRVVDIDAENLRRIWSGDIHSKTDMACYNKLYAAAVIAQRLVSAFQYEGFVSHKEDFEPRLASEIDLFKVGGKR